MASNHEWTWIDEEVTITPEALAEAMAQLTPRTQSVCASDARRIMMAENIGRWMIIGAEAEKRQNEVQQSKTDL